MTRPLAILLLSSRLCGASDYWLTNTATWPGGVAAGDTVHLVGIFTNTLAVGGSGAALQPITIRFESGAQFVLPGTTSVAIDLGSHNYLTVDGGVNGLIQWTNNGTGLSTEAAVSAISGTPTIGNLEIKNLVMTNMFIHIPNLADTGDLGQTIYLNAGASTNISVHNCKIYENRGGIFVAYGGVGAGDWRFYSNEVWYCSWGLACGDTTPNSVLNNVSVHHNRMSGFSRWDTSNNNYHEDGVYLWTAQAGSWMTNLWFYCNTFGPDNGNHATACIFASSLVGDQVYNVNVYNNVFYGNSPANGFISVTGARVFNNTFSGPSPVAIMRISGPMSVLNNIIDNPSAACNVTDANRATYGLTMDYSCYGVTFRQGGWGDAMQYMLSQWQSWFGYDAHSLTPLPGTMVMDAAAGNFHIATNSVCVGAGTNLTAYAALMPGITTDFDGKARPAAGAWDIGAYQGSTWTLTLTGPWTLSGAGWRIGQ